MKRKYFCFACTCLVLLSTKTWAYEPSLTIKAPMLKDPKELVSLQLQNLDLLDAALKNTAEELQGVRRAIVHYSNAQEHYLDHTDDRVLLYEMVKLADQINNKIESASFQHLFDSEFLEELATLSRLYRKMGLP